jgi:hypothetical protein
VDVVFPKRSRKTRFVVSNGSTNDKPVWLLLSLLTTKRDFPFQSVSQYGHLYNGQIFPRFAVSFLKRHSLLHCRLLGARGTIMQLP